ncbi:MAG: hypothetical protein H6822_13405 [Planctomycetaceae bacterium]|nr:hypothetical protein [Planctomycetales bacterium]MCB9923173.1 hypothetical protein [Planctomycetaceae bacterium]
MTRRGVAGPEPVAMLAKRIGNLATNVMVSGLILIVGITFGREIIGWWRGDVETSNASPTALVVGEHGPTEAASHQLLEFGDFPFTLNREEFTGSVSAAAERLRVTSRQSIDSARPLSGVVGDAERRMLDAARKVRPVAEVANVWSMHEIARPLPMIVGVRSFETQVATVEQRVVSWGMAVPERTNDGDEPMRWTLFTYSATEAIPSPPESLRWSMPPGGRRTLSIRSERGDAVAGFAGTGTVQSWTEYYDEMFTNLGAEPDSAWQICAGSWRRRFAENESDTIDVLIECDGDNVRSLVMTSHRHTPVPQRTH